MSEFHIGIGEATELRRSVLESLKSTVKALQRYEQFLQYRREREEEVARFRRLLAEIGSLSTRLSSEMPQTRAAPPHIPRGLPRSRAGGEGVSAEGADRLTKISQLDQLAKRLASIEDELKRMG